MIISNQLILFNDLSVGFLSPCHSLFKLITNPGFQNEAPGCLSQNLHKRFYKKRHLRAIYQIQRMQHPFHMFKHLKAFIGINGNPYKQPLKRHSQYLLAYD